MAVKPNWIRLTPEQRQEMDYLEPKPGWWLVPHADLPSVFPEEFRQKIDTALMIAAQTSTGGSYLVFSANRVDRKAQAVDIEPFGLIVHSTGVSASGVFLHHGDWESRTEKPPPQFWDEIRNSGIGNYFLTNPPEGRHFGTLDELPKGHKGAFNAIVSEIRNHTDKY
jgi:hypothetical protein